MQLSVVILNYNVRYFLELCLKSVEAALVSIDAEIIVVDNKSEDDSCEMVKRQFPKVKLIENHKNYGFSRGNNIGVAQAQGDYICILNPDTVVAEDTFQQLLELHASKTKTGALGCRLIDGNGRFLPESKRFVPTPKVAIMKMLGVTDGYYVKQLGEKQTGEVPVLVGAFMLMKRSVYNEVAGFDEDYFMYGDDIDLSYKLIQAGYNNLYTGLTAAIHFKGESTLKDRVYAQRFYGAMQIFYRKHFTSNLIFNGMVWLGVKLASWFQKPTKEERPEVEEYLMISSRMPEGLQKILGVRPKMQAEMTDYKNHTEYILDNNHLSFKAIIDILAKTPKNSTATFKILPKNSNFIIGSNSSKSKGAVVTF